MEKVLFATEELTGLIGAAVVMRPSKSVMDFEVKSLKKKFKDKRFAAGVNRDVIRSGAEMLGWELDELFARTIEAMRSFAPDKGHVSSGSVGRVGEALLSSAGDAQARAMPRLKRAPDRVARKAGNRPPRRAACHVPRPPRRATPRATPAPSRRKAPPQLARGGAFAQGEGKRRSRARRSNQLSAAQFLPAK